MSGGNDLGLQPPADGERRRSLGSASLGLTLLAVVAVVGFLIFRGPGGAPGSATTPSVSPAANGQASPPATPATTPSPQPTPEPSIVISGVLPGPDATVDPKAPPVIPGVSVQAVARAAAPAGLLCESDAGSFPGVPAGFTLSCTGHDQAAHANIAVTAVYWSLDGVSEIKVDVWSDAPDAVIDATFPSALFARLADLTTNDAASPWLQGKVGASACSTGCVATYDSVQVRLQVGLGGGQQLDITGSRG